MSKILKRTLVTLLVLAVLSNTTHLSLIYNSLDGVRSRVLEVKKDLNILTIDFIKETKEVTKFLGMLASGQLSILENLKVLVESQKLLKQGLEATMKGQKLLKWLVLYLYANVDPKPNFKKLRLSTVEIKVGRSGGAGTIIDQDENYLYVLTAKHMFTSGKGKISVRVNSIDNQSILVSDIPRSDNVRVDNLVDVGLIRIPKPHQEEFVTLSLAKALPTVGTKIYTIGHPLSFHYTMGEGIVSNYIDRIWEGKKGSYILVSASSFSGNSGGSIVNCYNELVGVVVGIIYVNKRSRAVYLCHLTIGTSLDNIYRFLKELKTQKQEKQEEKEKEVETEPYQNFTTRKETK